ncbi:hypothetical protein FP2506_17249 [Fulvimarina pelagi HTCC2506]|uniref:Uncharacterized protein n=1 Tax=Fulvimarina pelagi HTCC2506 TaxID=314231 RepID=Q0FXB6_9HYPH|nr:hypothetical protein FP2506_17249 [Fulvimarina pelagi HTCC2506]
MTVSMDEDLLTALLIVFWKSAIDCTFVKRKWPAIRISMVDNIVQRAVAC